MYSGMFVFCLVYTILDMMSNREGIEENDTQQIRGAGKGHTKVGLMTDVKGQSMRLASWKDVGCFIGCRA